MNLNKSMTKADKEILQGIMLEHGLSAFEAIGELYKEERKKLEKQGRSLDDPLMEFCEIASLGTFNEDVDPSAIYWLKKIKVKTHISNPFNLEYPLEIYEYLRGFFNGYSMSLSWTEIYPTQEEVMADFREYKDLLENIRKSKV